MSWLAFTTTTLSFPYHFIEWLHTLLRCFGWFRDESSVSFHFIFCVRTSIYFMSALIILGRVRLFPFVMSHTPVSAKGNFLCLTLMKWPMGGFNWFIEASDERTKWFDFRLIFTQAACFYFRDDGFFIVKVLWHLRLRQLTGFEGLVYVVVRRTIFIFLLIVSCWGTFLFIH